MREGSNYGQSIKTAQQKIELKLEEIVQIAHSKLKEWSGVSEQTKLAVKAEPCEVGQIETQNSFTLMEIPIQVAEQAISCLNEEIKPRYFFSMHNIIFPIQTITKLMSGFMWNASFC